MMHHPALPRGQALRRLIRTLHLWLALALCLPVVLQGLTGTAIVTLQIWQEEAPVATAAGTPHSPSEIVAAAQEAARATVEADLVPVLYLAPLSPGHAANVRFAPPGRTGPAQSVRLEIDPVTLEVRRIETPSTAARILHLFHSNLLLETRHQTGWIGLALLALAVTGLINWWPRPGRWRVALTVRKGAGSVQLYRQMHSAAGVWGALLMLMASLSGLGMAYPETARSLLGLVSPMADPRAGTPPITPREGAQPIGLDQAVTLALDAAPGMYLGTVSLPLRPNQPYRISLLGQGQRRGTPALTLIIDPWRAEIVARLDPAANSAGETVLGWLNAVHSGAGIGLPWQVLIFITGLTPAFFAATGVASWYLKRQRRRRFEAEAAAAASGAGE